MDSFPHSEDHINTVARALDARQTPRQQELARQIHDQLKAGAEVADVRDLITEMSRAMADESRDFERAERGESLPMLGLLPEEIAGGGDADHADDLAQPAGGDKASQSRAHRGADRRAEGEDQRGGPVDGCDEDEQ